MVRHLCLPIQSSCINVFKTNELYNILVEELFCMHGHGWQVNRHSLSLVIKLILLHFPLEVEYHDYAYGLA
jgi:hypothetical protein